MYTTYIPESLTHNIKAKSLEHSAVLITLSWYVSIQTIHQPIIPSQCRGPIKSVSVRMWCYSAIFVPFMQFSNVAASSEMNCSCGWCHATRNRYRVTFLVQYFNVALEYACNSQYWFTSSPCSIFCQDTERFDEQLDVWVVHPEPEELHSNPYSWCVADANRQLPSPGMFRTTQAVSFTMTRAISIVTQCFSAVVDSH